MPLRLEARLSGLAAGPSCNSVTVVVLQLAGHWQMGPLSGILRDRKRDRYSQLMELAANERARDTAWPLFLRQANTRL